MGRRGGEAPPPSTTPSAAALKQLANDAVQIARLSPVQREYVPTLGPANYPEGRGFAEATANIDVTARAKALQAILDACRAAEDHRRRLSHRAGFGDRRPQPPTAIAATSVQPARTSASPRARADGTGSGYYSGDHFDLGRLDAQRIAERGGQQGGPIAQSDSRSSRATTR